ncbi:DUF2207 domain-containing protein [Ornithinibacillus sp. 4-3]|uniref:DUF2207 domain-containing protein n=1 Tax=Ornithinibacillus sp. 4-3 TaxID=3231488 RepID=A0AB39HIS9_9BACI
MKKFIIVLTLIFCFLFPLHAFAVDFEITDAEINAYLQADGEVHVVEQFTYEFDGEFNGITRTIYPKTGTSIDRLSATENGQTLSTTKEGNLYKIFRSGEDETIKVELQYTIRDALVKHGDMTDFYWPFFDDRNEADYLNMEIAVHPPQPTDDVLALGYDSAYDTDSIDGEGVVSFQLGKVPSGNKGDIRVAYPSELFTGVEKTSDISLARIIKSEQKQLHDEEIAFAEKQNVVQNIAMIFIISTIALMIFLYFTAYRKKKERKNYVLRMISERTSFVPREHLSLAATILLLRKTTSGLVGIALLDFVRRGNVEQDQEQYKLIHQNDLLEHEKELIQWLFYTVGENRIFNLDDMKTYIDDKKNHKEYYKQMTNWHKGINGELKKVPVYESIKGLRLILFAVWLCSTALSVFTIVYELPILMIVAGFVSNLAILGYIIGYYPLTEQGMLIKLSWQDFAKRFENLSATEVPRMTEDEKARAYLFSMGMNNKQMKELISKFELSSSANDSSLTYLLIMNSGGVQHSFTHAEQVTSQSSSSSGSSSSGGGTGGGGGGSGAF